MSTDVRLVVFRSRLRAGVQPAYDARVAEIAALADKTPGPLSAKDFVAEDGERLTLIELDGADNLWRDQPEHERTQSDPARLRAIAERWLDSFARRDLDGLLELYAEGAVHTSPKIRALHPDTGGVLRGKDALRAWWSDAFARLPGLSYTLTALTADAVRVFIEYTRRVPGEADLPVAESLEVRDGRIVASQVFHG